MITNLNLAKVNYTYGYNRLNAQKAPSEPNFSGINKMYAKRVYVSSDYLKAINGVYAPKNGVVGELPIEIINEVKAQNPEDLSGALQEVVGVFTDSAKVLHKIESKKAFIDIDTLSRKFLDLKIAGDEEGAMALVRSVQMDEYAPEEFVQEIEEGATEVLKKGLKEKGVLKENDDVVIKYIGSGQFGDAFSVDFQDEEGESKFGKYVIKTYKDSDKLDSYRNQFKGNLGVYLIGSKYMATVSDYGKTPEGERAMGDLYNFIMDLYTSSALSSDIHRMFGNTNSIYAEANAAKFLEHANGGNIDNTDLVKTYFFNLKGGYSLVRFADDTLPAPEVHVGLEKYGLASNDMKEENFVQGRLIDYGSIVPISPETVRNARKDLSVISRDKVARRHYNRLKKLAAKSPEQAKAEYQRLQELAKNNHIPQNTSVLSGLELAKDLIEE